MARLLTLTRSRKQKRGVRKNTLPGIITPGPVTMIIGLIILFCVVSMFFLVQVFQSSTTGYQVSALEEKIDQLKEENKKLEIQAAELQSLDSIENSVREVNMVPVSDIVYIEPPAAAVVASNQLGGFVE